MRFWIRPLIFLFISAFSLHPVYSQTAQTLVQIQKCVTRELVQVADSINLSPQEKVLSYGGVTFKLSELTDSNYISLQARSQLSTVFDRNSVIAKDVDTVWDVDKFKTPRKPQPIAKIHDPNAFSLPHDLRILDMPIKMQIQQIIDHEQAMLGPEAMKKYYAYITVDQGWVEPGATQRKPGIHVDGFQGARIVPKNIINHSYIATDGIPTVFYPEAFDFSGLDEGKHDFFKEMDRTAHEANAFRINPNEIWLMDAYTPHRADLSPKRMYRTFFRLSFDVKEFDRLGNTHNPHFNYDWDMAARNVHSNLTEYRPREQCQMCGQCARGRALIEQQKNSAPQSDN